MADRLTNNKSNEARRQVCRDRVLLKDAVQKFDGAKDDATQAEARRVVERVALRGTGYQVTTPTPSERNEFAQIVSELVREPGSVGLHGIEEAVKYATRRLGIEEPRLPPEILQRLNRLI